MANRKLILDTFDNKETETVPSLFWFHFSPRTTFAGAPGNPALFRRTVEGHKQYFKEVPSGAIKIMTEGYLLFPSLRELAGYTGDALRAIRPIDPNDPWIEEQIELCKQLSTEADGKAAIFYTLFSPLSFLLFRGVGYVEPAQYATALELLGKSGVVEKEPEAFKYALDIIAGDIKLLSERLLTEGGADGIFFSVQNANDISKEDYLKYVAPVEHCILEKARAISDYNILHICGKTFANDYSIYSDYPAKAFNWASTKQGLSLKDGKALFGGKAVIGGFDDSSDSLVIHGSREEIEAYTEKLVEENGHTGFIIGADCSMPYGIDVSRIEWIREKAASL
jgi:uroporphyrinogen decarboxylase